jgi:hypothetical protein
MFCIVSFVGPSLGFVGNEWNGIQIDNSIRLAHIHHPIGFNHQSHLNEHQSYKILYH